MKMLSKTTFLLCLLLGAGLVIMLSEPARVIAQPQAVSPLELQVPEEVQISLLNNEIAKLNQRLDAMMESASAEGMQDLRNEIAGHSLSAAAVKMDVANNIILVFSVLVAIMTLIIAISAAPMKHWLQKSVLEETNKLIEKSISATTKLALAEMHSQLSFSFYNFYGAEFDEWRTKKFSGMKAHDIRRLGQMASFAAHLAERGFKLAEHEKETDIGRHPAWPRERAKLRNHRLYNTAAKIICERACGREISNKEKISIINDAEHCLNISLNSKVYLDLWYELHDTVAMVLVEFGDEDDIQRGISLVRAICEGHKPSSSHAIVPAERKSAFRREFGISA